MHDFLAAFEIPALVEEREPGRYWLPRSYAADLLFHEGTRSDVRRVSLLHETVIAFAFATRLHRDWGWPVACLGGQSARPWAFDAQAFARPDAALPAVAIEVKKSAREVARLITLLRGCCATPPPADVKRHGATENAARKWRALCTNEARLLAIAGPARLLHVFEVVRDGASVAALIPRAPEALHYHHFA